MRFSLIAAILLATAFRTFADDRPAKPPAAPVAWQWREMEAAKDGALARHIESVAFSADGSLVAAGAQDAICVWSAASGKLVTRMKLPEVSIYHCVAFSSDAKELVSHSGPERLLRVWDVKTGKQLREVPYVSTDTRNGSNEFKALSPGGTLAIFDVRGTHLSYEMQVVETATGKSSLIMSQRFGNYDHSAKAAFAPDGKTFAYNGPKNQLRILDAATGKLVKELQAQNAKVPSSTNRSEVRYSPDGKFIIAQEYTGRVRRNFDVLRHVIWGIADGRRYWEHDDPGGWLSADNRYLLTDTEGVLDLLTDELVTFENDPADKRELRGMSPDGKLLAFVGKTKVDVAERNAAYLSVYVAPAPVLPPVIGAERAALSRAELDFLWSGAVADNLFRRNHARKALAARPAEAIDLAGRNLKPVTAADRQRIVALLQQLEDDSADVRDKASTDLQAEAHRFESLLRASLEAAKSSEVRNRLTFILNKATPETVPASLVSELRGIEFLETIHDAKSRALLKALAGGVADARITIEAIAALGRLERSK